MTRLIAVEKSDSESQMYCRELENGNILFFPTCPFEFPKWELEFFLAQKQRASANRKNIAYKPQSGKITNFEKSSQGQEERLLEVMRHFSQKTVSFLSQLLSPYADKWQLDYASFRPFQERGRQLRQRARNDLLHVDSFPTRPMHGNRILRFFVNINPHENRCWTTTDSFPKLAAKFGGKAGIAFPEGVEESILGRLMRKSKKLAHRMGLPLVLRSPYDVFMLNFHNYLKENEEFQKNCEKNYWEFPPMSCWCVYTDLVSHAATAGQYALEQTIIVPRSALVEPEKAPVSVLEKLTGRCMVDQILKS